MGSAASRPKSHAATVFPEAHTNSAIGEALVSNGDGKKPSLPGIPGSVEVASEAVRDGIGHLVTHKPASLQNNLEGEPLSGRRVLYEGTLLTVKAVNDEDSHPHALANIQLIVSWPKDLFDPSHGRQDNDWAPTQTLATVVALRVDEFQTPADLERTKPSSGAARSLRSKSSLSQAPLPLPSPPAQQQQQKQQPLVSITLPLGLEPGSTLRCSSAAPPPASLASPCLSTPSLRRTPPLATGSLRGHGDAAGPPALSTRAVPSHTVTPAPSRAPTLPPIAVPTTTATAAAAVAVGSPTTTASTSGLRAGGLFLVGSQWSGVARDGPRGALRFRSCAPPGAVAPTEAGPQALRLELLPQPFLYHFALAYRHDEAFDLRDQFLRQLADVARRTGPLRVCDMTASRMMVATVGQPPTPAAASSRPSTSPSNSPPSSPLPSSPGPAPCGSTTTGSRHTLPAATTGTDNGAIAASSENSGAASAMGRDGPGLTVVVSGPTNTIATTTITEAAANLLVLLSPGVWDCEEVVSALRQVRAATASTLTTAPSYIENYTSRNTCRVLLMYMDAADVFGGCHVPTPCSVSSPVPELLDIATRVAVDPCKLMESAPEDVAEMLGEVETVAYRLHPYAAAAATRHVIQMGGCGSRLEREVAPSELEDYLSPMPADAPAPRPFRLPAGPRQLPTFYYEGVALRSSRPRDSAAKGTQLRGCYQAIVTFDDDASQIRMDLSYAPKIPESIPSYSEVIKLHWQPDSGSGAEDGEGGVAVQIGDVTPRWFQSRWEGRVAAVGGEMRLLEDQDELVLRPQPFFFHLYLASTSDAVASGLCGQLVSGLQELSGAGRRVRLYDSCGRPQDERHAAIDCSAAVLAVLTRSSWSDPAFCADVKRAAATGRRVLFAYDANPDMLSHVDPRSVVRGAPPGVISALLTASDVYPYYHRWYEQDACLRQLLRAAGLARYVQAPDDVGDFLWDLYDSQSDLEGLILLSERRWVYYEGVAERAGNVYGWYQVDAKFKPDLDLVELWMDFESKHLDTHPSCRVSYLLDWTRSDNSVTERQGRWRGRVGGMAGALSLVSDFGECIRLFPQPHIWHYFLSYEQRETVKACALLTGGLAELSVPGRRLRCWYDRQPDAANREARAQGVANSQHFALLLSPSALQSASIRYEIQVALSLRKSTLVLYDPDNTSRTHVDLSRARTAAAPGLRALFDGPCLPWPAFREGNSEEVVRRVMEAGGFTYPIPARPRGARSALECAGV